MSEVMQKEKGHLQRNWVFYLIIVTILCLSGFLCLNKSYALKSKLKHLIARK